MALTTTLESGRAFVGSLRTLGVDEVGHPSLRGDVVVRIWIQRQGSSCPDTINSAFLPAD